MKMRNKGKVHPFTTSSSPSSPSTQTTSNTNNDAVYPVLNLLPTAIFSLISILSTQDRQVLAYMLSRSEQDKKYKSKKHCTQNSAPHFDCDCFNCYTSFWFRWDTSPNRDLIHQAIEAFESNEEISSLVSKGKKKDKVGRRKVDVLTTPAAVLDATAEEVAEEVVVMVVEGRSHRGLARKVLPDVMGIFNSRLWRLWSPNV